MDPVSFIAKIISDGRITIPNEIRMLVGADDGDLVVCTVSLAKSSKPDGQSHVKSTESIQGSSFMNRSDTVQNLSPEDSRTRSGGIPTL